MATEIATNRIQRELEHAVATLRTDLDRIELLTAALIAFSRPVPDYEPTFRHIRPSELMAHEIGTPVHE